MDGIEKRGTDDVFFERTLSHKDLLDKWSGEWLRCVGSLQSATEINELVDNLSQSGRKHRETLRRIDILGNGEYQLGKFDREALGFFREFEKAWSTLKYNCMIKALALRRRGNREILADVHDIRDAVRGPEKRLVMCIAVPDGKTYRTQAPLSRMHEVIPAEQLKDLLGKTDMIPQEEATKHIKGPKASKIPLNIATIPPRNTSA